MGVIKGTLGVQTLNPEHYSRSLDNGSCLVDEDGCAESSACLTLVISF